MAVKKTYIYRLEMGHQDQIEETIFIYARNAGIAVDYCKTIYKDKKYDHFHAIKVGASNELRETSIFTKDENERIRKTNAVGADAYAEREMELSGIQDHSGDGSDASGDIPERQSQSV